MKGFYLSFCSKNECRAKPLIDWLLLAQGIFREHFMLLLTGRKTGTTARYPLSGYFPQPETSYENTTLASAFSEIEA
jgi:hypothetical protein